MSKSWVIVLLALAVIAVGAFFALSGPPDLEDPGLEGRGGGDAARESATDQGQADPTLGRGQGTSRPSLFGRAHVRIGTGDAIGRLVDFITKEPVAGATIRISGDGYGGEKVTVDTESGEDGRFQLRSVPAGEDLELAVAIGGSTARKVTGLVVSARKVEDLGTIWLGDAGTLEGRVLGMTGKGIGDAEIQVLQGKFSQEQMMQDFFGFLSKLDRDPVPVATGESDAAGRFRIEGVPPGPITVVARVPNHHHAIKAAAMSKDGAVGGPVELRVTEAEPIAGRVVTKDGDGFAGARIAFLDQEDDEAGFFGRRFVETASDGAFRVDSPPPARELVAIIAAEGYPTLFSEVKGERTGLQFTLIGGSSVTLRFVHDDSGEPIADAAIVAMLSETENMGNSGTFLTGLTDEAGNVEFAARPGFVNMIMFQHSEHGSSMYSPQFGMFGAAKGLALKGPTRLEIVAGDNAAEFRKPRGVTVRGVVSNEAGQPIAGATVTSSGGMFGLGAGSKALTDEAGAYQLVAPATEQLMVFVEAPGFVQDPETRSANMVEGAFEIEHAVTLLQAARVEGKVVGKAGGPVAGIEVRMRALKEEGDQDQDMMIQVTGRGAAKTAITDGQGRFLLDDVAPGHEYYVVGRGEGYIVTSTEPFPVERGGHTVRAPLLKLQEGVAVKVEVRDPSGDVVSGARVNVNVAPKKKLYWDEGYQWRPHAKLMTDASGMVEAKDLPDGEVTFEARAEDAAPARMKIQVSAASPPTAPVVVRLRPAITISGMVVDQHGDVVKDANVGVGQNYIARAPSRGAAREWIPHLYGRTDRFGRFEIKGVPDGVAVMVTVNAQGYRAKPFPVEGRPDGLRLVVHKIDPEIQKRRDALQQQMMALYGKMQGAKDEGERAALMEELTALQQEMSSLEGGPGGMVVAEVAAEPEVDEVIEDR